MATSWEDLELNDLSLKDLRITTPPPPPPGKKPSESASKAPQGADYGTPPILKPKSAAPGGAADTADNPHGVDKALFDTLKDAKERIQVLRFEVEVERFVQDGTRERFEFPGQLTPFHRMIAHRVAQHYFLQTSVETQDDGVRVVAWKIPRADHKPSVRLVDVPMPTESSTASGAGAAAPGSAVSGSGGVGTGSVKVMRRVGSKEGTIGAEQQQAPMDADTMERIAKQREEEYNIARQRIFSSGNLAAGGSGSEGDGDGDASVLSEPGRAEGTDEAAAPSPAADAMDSPDQGASGDRDGNSAADPNGTGSVPSPTGSSSGGGKAGGGNGGSGSKGRPGSGKGGRRQGNEGGEEGGQQSGGKGRSRGGRQKAVFRDKDKDSMDPDFRRGRHRFEQRYDPNAYGGMPMVPGGHGAIYAMPTYTSEFPSLAGGGPMGIPHQQGGHHGAPLVPHMLPPQQQPPPPPPPQQQQQQQGHHQQQSHQHQHQQWPHGAMQQQGVPPGMPPQYAGQPQGGHPHQHPSMPPQYGGMRMPPPYGMHPQPGMYHPHHPPPPLPFGGIPMPPAGHYGFMPPHPHVQSPTGGQPQPGGGAQGAAAAAAAAAAAHQFYQQQAFAMQQQQQGYGPEGVASIVTPPPSGDGKQ